MEFQTRKFLCEVPAWYYQATVQAVRTVLTDFGGKNRKLFSFNNDDKDESKM